VDEYPDTTVVGEIGDEAGVDMVALYTGGGDKLHMAYCFDLLQPEHSAPHLHAVLHRFERAAGDGWPCWALSNHDVTRLATRWGGEKPPAGLLRLAAALQLSLRGTSCIYQGDELGLTESDVPFEALQDPYGITMWPEIKGRDGCRTPMAWEAETPDLGFGSAAARPWLPLDPRHRPLAADRQEADSGSLLHHYRHLLRWRRGVPALTLGTIDLWPVHEQVLAYVREHAGERVLCAFNLSGASAVRPLPAGARVGATLADSGAGGARVDAGVLQFDPWGVLFARLD